MSAQDGAPAESETPPAWWSEARFGMFIHWGVYAVPAGEYLGKACAGASEWLMKHAEIPVADYKRFADKFDAAHYDPEAWARAAADAGMKYLVIAAKHHDGFALFASKASSWNSADAAACRRDLLAPLVAACRKAGLRIGFYYSHAQDWANGGAAYGPKWDPAQDRDFDDYLDNLAIPQIRELLTLYAPDAPALLWWDTPAEMTPARAARVDAAVQSISPGILQNDRLGGGAQGQFSTPEQRIPATRPSRAWETCMTTNESWGYYARDQQWKPASLLIRQLCEVASQGGNYLLNVGPMADGTIPPPSLDALSGIGGWMRRHGMAIHSSSAGPFPHRLPWGFATCRDLTVYLLVERWPQDGWLDVPLLDLPESAKVLGPEPLPLPVVSGPGKFRIELAVPQPDEAVSVIVLRFSVRPRLGDLPPLPRPPVIPQPADGAVALAAADAEVVGEHIGLTTGPDAQIWCWSSLDSHPLWRVRLHKAGTYRVELDYAVPRHREGTLAEITFGETRLPFTTSGTGGWGEFVRAEAGFVELKPCDELPVRVLPISMPAGAVMNLKGVYLTPATER